MIVTALALTAAAFSACQPPTSAPAHSSPSGWQVKDTDTSRDGTTNTYTATCILTDGSTVTAWREVSISQTQEYALNTGDRCPSGTAVEYASCHTDASAYDLHPDTAAMRAKAPIVCENGE